MVSRQELEKQKNIDIKEININDLAEAADLLDIDLVLPLEQRLKIILEKMGNPYVFKSKNRKVVISHSNNGVTLDETIIKHFIDHL